MRKQKSDIVKIKKLIEGLETRIVLVLLKTRKMTIEGLELNEICSYIPVVHCEPKRLQEHRWFSKNFNKREVGCLSRVGNIYIEKGHLY